MRKEISPKIIALTFGILTISFLAAFYVVAWQEPSQAPPGGNVPIPLNVGPNYQEKVGPLVVNRGGAATGLIIDKGKVCIGTDCRDKWPETGVVTTYKMEASGYKVYNSVKGYDEYFSKTVSYDCPVGSDVVNIYCGNKMVGERGTSCTGATDSCPPYNNVDSCSCSKSNNKAYLAAQVVQTIVLGPYNCTYDKCNGANRTNYCYPYRVTGTYYSYDYGCYIPTGTPQCWMEFQCGIKQTVGQ